MKTTIALAAALAAAASLTACGGSRSSDKVWCVAPGEPVTAALKRDYPELYIPRSACDEANR